MSGICGIVNIVGMEPVQEALVSSMARSMLSIGGEESKALIDGVAGLGVSSRGIRDHFVDDKDIFVIALGEIFEPAGAHIAGTIARLYRQYKEKCVEHLNGQFNFCVWDKRDMKLIVVNDHFGTSALNYYYDGAHFIFASKIRALLKTSLFSASIDKNAIYNYCTFTFVPTPQTIYKEIKKLPPGHMVILADGKMGLHKYWDIAYKDGANKGEKYYCEKIREELEGAVKRRFDPVKDDGRVGAFLSGGLDSSTVAGLMKKVSGKEVNTFSIGFQEEKYSEIGYVDMAAAHFGLKSHKYCVGPRDLMDAINILVKEFDEPFGNSSAIAAYYCAKMAKDNGVDVLLGGDGGDENFGGYERYVTNKIYSIYQRFPCFLRQSVIEPSLFSGIFKNAPLFEKIRNYIGHSNIPNPERFCLYELYPMRNRDEIFSADFLKEVNLKAPLELLDSYYRSPDTKYSLNRLMYLDAKIGLIDNDLRNKIDKVSQITGVGVRFPMLDLKLWELGSEIPSGLKLKGFTKKYIYKKAFGSFLPRQIIVKKKHGFGLPYAVWLRTDPRIRKFTEEMLLDPSAGIRPYFRKDFFEKMLRLHDDEKTPYYGDMLWIFLMLEAWHREWAGR